MSDRDAFYVGYHGKAPVPLARTNRRRTIGYGVVALIVAGVLAVLQGSPGEGHWDFAEVPFEGFLEAGAVPTLAVMQPGDSNAPATFDRVSLVAPTKFGANELVEAHHGKWVRLTGSLISRDGVRMIAVTPDTVEQLSQEPAAPNDKRESLGEHTFEGEIVDSKCYLGAMRPGNLKPHKQCAILCIQGGIPPVLLVRDAEGLATYLHLVGPNGEAVNAAVLPFVAEPIAVHGAVERQGNIVYLKADPSSFTRL